MKKYMIITNDIYELPVAIDIQGTKGVAAFLGMHHCSVRRNLSTNKWDSKKPYRAIEMPKDT